MEPKMIDKFSERKKADRKRRPSSEKPKKPSVEEVLQESMKKRILQALQDEVTGITADEIERRVELAEGEHQLYRTVFRQLRDQGTLAKTATGYKRGRSPFAVTGGVTLG